MKGNLISYRLQADILKVLSVFHPHALTGEEYSDCFGDNDEYQILQNVISLISRGLISCRAVTVKNGETTLKLCHLRLTGKGINYAAKH